MSKELSADRLNIKHLEECPGCTECDALLEFYMACDGCGSWGHVDSDGFQIFLQGNTGIGPVYCEFCAANETKEGE